MTVSAIAGTFKAVFADSTYVWPGGVRVDVERFSFMERGGCDAATLTASGDGEQLTQLFALLGREVYIYNPSHDLVWWGLIHDVGINFGAAGAGASFERMSNRVKVTYTEVDAFGNNEARETEWGWGQSSIDRYGEKELIESIGEGNEDMAAARQAQLLDRLKWPRPRRISARREGNGALTATINLRGRWHFIGWKNYTNAVGRIEHTGSASLALVIGAKLTASTKVGFVKRDIGDTEGKLGWLLEGDKVTISGSSINDGVYTVEERANPDTPRVYVSNTVYFEEDNDIKDDWSEFEWVEGGQFIQVEGSVKNSGYHFIRDREGAGHFEIRPQLSQYIFNEAPGPTITIHWGHSVRVDIGTLDEMPGWPVTFQSWNEVMALRFTPSDSITLRRVALSLGKHGTPTDDLLIEICADNGTGDYPGSVLSTVTVDPDDLPDDQVLEQWFTCDQDVTAGTMYWLKVRRSGTATWDSYYLLGLMEKAGIESVKAWDNTEWRDISVWRIGNNDYYSIPFRLHDAVDTSVSIGRIIENCGQSFVTAVEVDATGVEHNQWVETPTPALQELERLFDIGTSSGERLVAHISPLGTMAVTVQALAPDDEDDLPVLGTDGNLYTQAGSARPAGVSPAGQWVRLAGVPKMAGLDYRLSPDYVRAAEYDVQRAAWNIALRDDLEDIDGL